MTNKIMQNEFLALCLVITPFLGLLFLRRRYLKKIKQVEKRFIQIEKKYYHINLHAQKKISHLERTITSIQPGISDFTYVYDSSLKKHDEDLNATSELKNTEIYKAYHMAILKNDISKINSSQKKQLIDTIEGFFPDFSFHIIKKCPSVSEDELYLCYLCKANIISPSVQSLFMCIAPHSVTMKRNRLYQKLFNINGNKKMFEEFINSL